MIRVLKSMAKSVIRSGVRWRLHHLPLSAQAAESWADRLKAWPGIFDETSVSRIVPLAHDVRMQVGLVDHIERHLWLHREWDRPVKTVLETLLKPGDTYFDLGANVGYFTLIASRLVGPTGCVVAVEPSTRAIRKLTAHLWLNHCRNVLLISGAAGDAWARSELALATESNIGGSGVAVSRSVDQATEQIWIAPLDHVMQNIGLRPRLIKMDLEGYELHALRGVIKTIEAAQPWIICEVTEQLLQKFASSTQELFAVLSSFGYQPFVSNTNDNRQAWTATNWETCAATSQQDVLFVPRGQSIEAMLPA
jgi:FkbM family methyltransferase